MPYIRPGGRLSAALLVVSLLVLPGAASAQDGSNSTRLKLPTLAASAAAAADWASTYHAIKHFELRETNPLLRPFEGEPGRLVTVGAAMDAVAFSAWNLALGRKHPKVAAAGLWAMAGFRAYLTIHNMRNMQRVPRRPR